MSVCERSREEGSACAEPRTKLISFHYYLSFNAHSRGFWFSPLSGAGHQPDVMCKAAVCREVSRREGGEERRGRLCFPPHRRHHSSSS